MALSLSNFLVCLCALLPSWFASQAAAATVTHDFNVTWVLANPDGLAVRPVIGINDQWPIPMLNFTKGDNIVINLHNGLGNTSTSLHFHGLWQNGTTNMDGPVGVVQCNVPPGHTFVYNFTIDQPGTYWYHSHSPAQYPDGLRGEFVVHDPENPYADLIDQEVAISVSDWYHDLTEELMKEFVSYKNPTGAEPIPKSALMNDTQNLTVAVQPGLTYFIRMANIGAFAGQYFWIEGHNMTIIEVDGVYTEPAVADMIYLAAAQRYGVLVTAKNSTSQNFPMMASMDTSLFDTVPDTLQWNTTGWLVYDDSADLPAAKVLDEFAPFDDFTLTAEDGLELYEDPAITIELNLTMNNLGNGASYAFFNDKSYVSPIVPTLYSVMTTGANATDAAIYGTDTNAYVLKKNDIVEIVLNNFDTGKHPFHLHGHNFQAVWRSATDAGPYESSNESAYPAVPMRRDTFMTYPTSNFVIRWKADNPGVWFFHCHIEWHFATGLAAVMIEDPLSLQQSLTIPQNQYDICKADSVPTAGNAAGNTEDYLDLKGENREVKPLPAGFTASGIVALVFSCISAFLGMAAIAWYGSAPLSAAEMAKTKRFVARAGVTT